MISVKVSNFQSIKDTEIEIDKFSVLSAPNNLGKSATIRAIKQALFPSSGSFVRKGATFAEISVSWKDESGVVHIVVRRKGPNINTYMIDGKSYDRVGREQVPELAALGFYIIEEVEPKINLNISSQFEPPFMLEATNQVIGYFLNKFSRASVIQRATKKVQVELSELTSQIRLQESELEKVKKEIKIIYSEDIKGMLKSLETIELKRIELESKLISLQAQVGKRATIKKEIKGLEETFGLISLGDLTTKTAIYASVCDYVELKTEVNELKEATSYKRIDLEKVRSLVNKFEPLETILEGARKSKKEIKILESIPDRNIKLLGKTQEASKKYTDLDTKMSDIRTGTAVLRTIDDDLKEKHKLIDDEHRVLQKMKQDAKVCPLCNKPF